MKKKYIIKKARKLLVEQINSHQTIVRNDMNNIETMSNMKGLSEVIPKDNDGYCTIYKMDCADGLGLMTVYQVFPGIQLIYNDFEATEYEWESILDKDILEIKPSPQCLVYTVMNLSVLVIHLSGRQCRYVTFIVFQHCIDCFNISV